MNQSHIIYKGAAIALFLFLQSCISPCCRQWCYEEICTPNYFTKKIILPTDNIYRGIEIQLLHTRCGGQQALLDIHTLSFPMESNALNATAVKFECGNEIYDCIAIRFEGGQRLLLPKEAEEYIIAKLLEGKSLMIRVGRFYSEITPAGFCKAYQKFYSK